MHRAWIVPLGLALLTAPAGAQQQPPQPPPFRSGVQVVEVDVRIFDKDGRFVTTLRRDDFEVLEDGVPQQVVAISLVGAAPEAAANSPTSPPSTQTTTATRTYVPTTARHTWVFFFDLNHLTPGGGFDRARTAAAEFIRDRFKEGDLAGVVAGTSLVNNRFTTVREELVAAVNGVKPLTDSRTRQIELTREWPRLLNEDEAAQIVDNRRDAIDRAVTRACQDDPSACARVSPEPDVRQKAQRLIGDMRRATLETLSAVNALASGLARMAGPKTIVFLSDGFPVSGAGTTLRGVVGQAARAGARVYAIDVRGLNRGRGAGIIDQDQVDNELGAPPSFDAQADGPNSLAVGTGGMMIRNENNIGRALDTIAADSNRYYVIGYQPANTAFDGKYRQIEVRVKREGVRVRARRGYLALEPAKMLAPQPITAPDPSPDESHAARQPGAAEVAPRELLDAAPSPALPAAIANAPGTRPAASADAPVRLRPGATERVRTLSGTDAAPADNASGDGWAAYQRGDLEAALPLLAEAAAQPDVRPWVLYALGLTQSGLGNPREAIASWERTRTAAPDYAPIYIDLAATYAHMADLTSALTVLRDAEKRWPASVEVLNGIGVIHIRRDALDEAIAAFTRAAAAAPDDALSHLNLGRAYELRYERGRRFVTSQGRWAAPEGDRQRAAASYERCVTLGGPYAARAAAALNRLQWSK